MEPQSADKGINLCHPQGDQHRTFTFFTPYEISKMFAQISIMDADVLIQKDGFISVSDPAAGAGSTILAAADILEEEGHILHECMSVHVTELSKMTYYMLYIQLALRGIAAQVVHGNSLTMEVFESSYTPVSLVFVEKHGRLFKAVEKETENQESPKNAQLDFNIAPIINAEQMNLFG